MGSFNDPNIINNGLSGYQSSAAAMMIDKWLVEYPADVYTLNFGTNDNVCNKYGNMALYITNMRKLINKLRGLGKIVFIPTVPWTSRTGFCVEDKNSALEDSIFAKEPNLRGVDAYTLFKNNPRFLSTFDYLHPTREGYVALKKLWIDFIANQHL